MLPSSRSFQEVTLSLAPSLKLVKVSPAPEVQAFQAAASALELRRRESVWEPSSLSLAQPSGAPGWSLAGF